MPDKVTPFRYYVTHWQIPAIEPTSGIDLLIKVAIWYALVFMLCGSSCRMRADGMTGGRRRVTLAWRPTEACERENIAWIWILLLSRLPSSTTNTMEHNFSMDMNGRHRRIKSRVLISHPTSAWRPHLPLKLQLNLAMTCILWARRSHLYLSSDSKMKWNHQSGLTGPVLLKCMILTFTSLLLIFFMLSSPAQIVFGIPAMYVVVSYLPPIVWLTYTGAIC